MKILAALLPAAGLLAAALAAEPPRPNVLLVINDDQSWLECSAYGHSSIPTPHFDRVARDGVLFTRGYAGAPSCAPSRAALLTGRNLWELEQGAFIQAWLPPAFTRLPDRLAAAGYHVGYTGKGWGPGVPPPGGAGGNPAGPAYHRVKIKAPPAGISNIDYVGNLAAFLDARPPGQPFYFWMGLQEPHHPHGADNYRKLGVDPAAIRVPGFLPDTPGVRRHRANYLYEVKYADDTLGAALRLLQDRGALSNTLVVVTADNGTPAPRAKANVYDWGLRVPLAMMWPARVPGGRIVDDFIHFADLAPTLLAAAGLPAPPEMSGRSALDVLLSGKSGRVDPARSFTTGGLEWHGELPPCGQSARMIRDERFQYIVNYSDGPRFILSEQGRQPDAGYAADAETMDVSALLGAHRGHPAVSNFVALIQAPRPREELYDCAADPDELRNLAADPAFAADKARLRARLEAYQRHTGDPRITGEMAVFEKTRAFVIDRKRRGYKETE